VSSVGSVAPGFEAVREIFDEELADFGRGGGAFCAYVEGERVVDLWGGHAKPDLPWSQDTITTLFSATKGMAALCAQVLYDRGQLDVDSPVAEYWPEFAQAGKERALVRQVLAHTVGVLALPDPESLLDWEGRGWGAYEEIAARLAASAPEWEPGSKVGYHAVTYGWLLGELVTRITGMSIGAFFHDAVAVPLGLDLWIGTPYEQQRRLADLIEWSDDDRVPEDLARLLQAMRDPDTLLARSHIFMHGGTVIDNVVGFFGNPQVRALEIAGSNGSGTARGLARMYALLSMGGELDGTRIVSPESVAAIGAEAAIGPDALWPWDQRPTLRWSLGHRRNLLGPGQLITFGPVDEAFGITGLGGQIAFCDPVNRVAVAYVRNHLTLSREPSAKLVDAVYQCLDGVRP
jgi:CubicO group peptidase (beta-lactamase class C family)